MEDDSLSILRDDISEEKFMEFRFSELLATYTVGAEMVKRYEFQIQEVKRRIHLIGIGADMLKALEKEFSTLQDNLTTMSYVVAVKEEECTEPGKFGVIWKN